MDTPLKTIIAELLEAIRVEEGKIISAKIAGKDKSTYQDRITHKNKMTATLHMLKQYEAHCRHKGKGAFYDGIF